MAGVLFKQKNSQFKTKKMKNKTTFAILGGGNIGTPLGQGIYKMGLTKSKIILTRKSEDSFTTKQRENFECMTNNVDAIKNTNIIVIAVQPGQTEDLIKEISSAISKKKNQLFISVVTGKSIDQLQSYFGDVGSGLSIVRAMPNTSLKTGNSMTCLAFNKNSLPHKEIVLEIFNALGKTLIIEEKMFIPATVLCGSGTAIFARMVRSYMSAGIQNGFNEKDALKIAIQVMKGTSILLEESSKHPEEIVDGVTTPNGLTIEALVVMEKEGFGSSLIAGIGAGITKGKTF